MNISINVISVNKVTIGTLDVNDSEMNIIYQMADVREPDKKKTNYVRQFKLPGTKNNNRIFSEIFENGYTISDIDVSSKGKSFNPSLKLTAQVVLNNNIFFEGNLQLNKINKIDNKLVDYEVTIYGSLADFFSDISDSDLNTLDISEYNHKLNRNTICHSWNMRGAGKDIVWKKTNGTTSNLNFADKIYKFGSLVANDIGDGYVYPLFYNGGEDLTTTVTTEKWAPSVYVYTIMKKIFDKFGYKWKSSFFESETFKRLIVPFSKESLLISQSQVERSEFRANVGVRDSSSSPIMTQHSANVAETKTSGTVKFPYDTTSPASPAPFNPGHSYYANDGIWIVPKNGMFHVQAKLQCLVKFMAGTNFITTIKPGNMPFKAKLINATTNAVLAEKSGEWLFPTAINTFGPYQQVVPVLVDFEGFLSVATQLKIVLETTMPVGNTPSKTMNISGADYPCTIYTMVIGYVNDSSYLGATLVDKNAQDGDEVNMNQVLPEMSIKDFIGGINKMFNLYWVSTGDKEFVIEPRDTLFKKANGVILNWTKQVNNGEVLSIEPLYDLTANKYIFTYKADTDYYNKKYIDSQDGIYGDKVVSVENDFQTDTEKVETAFSPSPLMSPPFNSGIIMTSFCQKDGTKFKRHVPKVRILYWGGMKPYSGSDAEIKDVYNGQGTYLMRYMSGLQVFPYAGHLDNPQSPSIDLNYGVSKEYYFSWATLTDNNLYNSYWKGFVDEIIDPNQHLLTCKLYLPGRDLFELDLRTTIQVDNIYYRINKITYNPITSIAEAELFKLKDYKPFSSSSLSSGATTLDPGAVGPWGKDPNINTGFGGWGIWKGDSPVTHWSADRQTSVWGQTLNMSKMNTGYPTLQWKLANDQAEYAGPFNSSMDRSPSFDRLPLQSWSATRNDTNSYADSGSNIVLGKYNVVAPTAKYVSVQGSFNNVADSAERVSVVGDYNTILSNVSNVTIVGNNIVASKSNTSYIDGIEIGNRSVTMAKTNVVKSPKDLNGGVIMGGKNSVGAFAKRKATRVVNGNGPTLIAATNRSAIANAPLPQLPDWYGGINRA